jgi:hypothetical protein
MTDLYGRAWRVTVGDLQTTTLDVVFDIERATFGVGKATVQLFGLSESNRNTVRDSRGTLLKVEAGYAQTGLGVIFQGDVRRADTERDGADWIAHITGGDGEDAMHTARVSRSFGSGATVADLVSYVAGVMGVDPGNAVAALGGAGLDNVGTVFPMGVVLHGRALPHFTAVLRAAGLTWSVQDGTIQVVPLGGALQRTAVLLGEDSGLVGSPEQGKNGVVKARALLVPDLVPGQLVQITSAGTNGLFRIMKVHNTGDTHGTDWYADMSLRGVS